MGDTKYYYSDCIRARDNGRNYLFRSMVFPSNSHDWLMVMLSYRFDYTDIKKRFSSGTEYLDRYPLVKDKFYGEVRRAIVSVEPFTKEGEVPMITSQDPLEDKGLKDKLLTLKKLKDDGLITEDEYDRKRKSLINSY